MTDVIEISHLDKSFGAVKALDDFHMSVAAGEVAGFLGPNGAGKSTTVRVLLGMLRADSGTVRVLGGDPWSDAVALHERMAYVTGDVSLWPNLTGGEVIDLLGRMNGGLEEQRRADLLERFELDPTKKARTYSKGNRQKVALVAALARRAELYLFDEPTSGLDPLMEAVFQDCVAELKKDGATVLLSSHILAEVEALCDRVTIIRAGVNVLSGTLADLRHLTRTTVIVETERSVDLAALDAVHGLQQQDGRLTFEVESDQLTTVLEVLTPAGVRSLQAHPPTLEELFLSQYADEIVEPV